MAPPHSAEWQSHPSITEEVTSFQEVLKQDPFEGAAVVAALARVIKATDALQHGSNGRIGTGEAGKFVIENIAAARETAEAVPDPVYAHMFRAQEKGWKGAIRATRATRAAREPKPQAKPTQTAGKSMSDSKSNT